MYRSPPHKSYTDIVSSSQSLTPTSSTSAPSRTQSPTESTTNITTRNKDRGKGKETKLTAEPSSKPTFSRKPTSYTPAPSERDNELQQLREALNAQALEIEQLRSEVARSTAPVIPPSVPAPTLGIVLPSTETDQHSETGGRHKSRRNRRKTPKLPLSDKPNSPAPSSSLSEPNDSERIRDGQLYEQQSKNHSRSPVRHHASSDRSRSPASSRSYHPKPTNLASKLSDGTEPKASLWKMLVLERLDIYANTLDTESARRAYVIDQTEGEAQQHLYALYMQIPRLTAKELIQQLAAIYSNPVEVERARTQYDHWRMPNGSSTRHGHFVEWYRTFRLLATQAEITDDSQLFRDLESKISDNLARAVALHKSDCRTTEELANKLTIVDENEVSIQERNRYHAPREPVPAKKPTMPAHPLQTGRSLNYPGTGAVQPAQPKSSFPPRNTPARYTGTLKQSPAPPGNFNRKATPAPGTKARSPTPRTNLHKMEAAPPVSNDAENHPVEDFYDAKDHLDPQIHAEDVESARQAEDIRLKANA
ncbi:hypothetical protein DSL72_008440 [Monilinia vaccinii-corymbosi]|uniref:Uncharacterized protein n=1 Tax=Monilinia vaccinii-corymbosi TaxID=61207 RepID=A0A8A3PKD6_9HELO|nr:hypothetical protein DSL72_008440 [Monilinia vaccinii-corymbosi]